MWDNIQGGFLDHLEEVERDLKNAGLPSLEYVSKVNGVANGVNGKPGDHVVRGKEGAGD
jgi:hypothetical protein